MIDVICGTSNYHLNILNLMSLHCMHVHELPQIYYELYMSVLYDMYSAGSVYTCIANLAFNYIVNFI